MKNILFFSFAFIFLMSLGACKKTTCDNDAPDCSAFAPPIGITCQMYVQGYYYDSEANECIFYSGSACNAPPFTTEQECSICECAAK